MTKKYRYIVILCLTLLAGCGALGLEAPADSSNEAHTASKPNIIYILADDLGYGDIGALGQKHIKTPNIDALIEGGTLFTHHYSGAPVCAPSRGTLLTGKHTGNAQIRGNNSSNGVSYLKKGTDTLGTILQSAGYKTGLIGKWGLGEHTNEGAPKRQGIDYFFGVLDQVLAHNYYPEYLWENETRIALNNNGITMHPKHVPIKDAPIEEVYKAFIGNDYSPYLMQDKALEFIKTNSDRPFFLYYASLIPHAALQIPDEALEPYSFDETPFAGGYYSPHPRPRAARAAMISLLDEQVGEIVALTEKLGIADNTLIVFTSDNGAAYEISSREDVEFFNSTAGFRGAKRSTFDGGIRAPMVTYWPGTIAPNSESSLITAMWDMLPTFADLAGVSTPKNIDGLSIAPTLTSEGEQALHSHLYWEFHEAAGDGPAQAVRMGKWKAIRLLKGYEGVPLSDVPIMLFDTEADRGEVRDVSQSNPEVVSIVSELMKQRRRSESSNWNFE